MNLLASDEASPSINRSSISSFCQSKQTVRGSLASQTNLFLNPRSRYLFLPTDFIFHLHPSLVELITQIEHRAFDLDLVLVPRSASTSFCEVLFLYCGFFTSIRFSPNCWKKLKVKEEKVKIPFNHSSQFPKELQKVEFDFIDQRLDPKFRNFDWHESSQLAGHH